MEKGPSFEVQRMEGLDTSRFSNFDTPTLNRFIEAFKKRGPNLVEFQLSKEMGFDYGLVSAQELILLAEEKDLMDRLYAELKTNDPQELMEKLVKASKETRVSESIGAILVNIGIDPMDLLIKPRVSYAKAFLMTVDTPEGAKKLQEALDELGY